LKELESGSGSLKKMEGAARERKHPRNGGERLAEFGELARGEREGGGKTVEWGGPRQWPKPEGGEVLSKHVQAG